MNEALRKVLKRLHYPLDVMLTCVRWYVAYPLSMRHIKEIMHERGVVVDHTTIHRWSLKILPVMAAEFRRRKCQVSSSWRLDETYVRVHGQSKYCTAPSIKTAIPWISCLPPDVIWPRHAAFWNVPSPARLA